MFEQLFKRSISLQLVVVVTEQNRDYRQGSYYYKPCLQGLQAGFVVVWAQSHGFQVVSSGKIEPPSAETAGLVALKEALLATTGQSVNIFTYSAFSYHVVKSN